MKNVYWTVVAFLAPVMMMSVIAWAVTDPKTVTVTEVINRIPDTQYCYTTEDGDWLICRLKEGVE